MSVVGFDIGNESCLVAVARQRGIDVILNDESKRETPAVVCFGEKQRFIGTAGASSSIMNPKNSISQIKRLIGRKFSDPEVQRDIKMFPFEVKEGPDGFPLIHAKYLGVEKDFTPTQILSMILSDLKGIAEKNLKSVVVDCCIGIPVYFTDLQRRAVLDAASIAGLNPLRLFHETTATALAYGIYKTDLPEDNQVNVAFVDVGHASMQVCIAGYKKGQLKVLGHAFDRCLGGRDFDEVIFQHFAAKFREEYRIDVSQNARASFRLRTACEKLKKMLSANPEAPLNIECLMDDKDVRGFLKRDELEQISVGILHRVRAPLERVLADTGLLVENIHSVEVVGSGSRVPFIIKILTDFFGKEPRRTMNASECVSRGCALQCAILSPTFKVRDFQVHENFPYSISLSWKGASSDPSDDAVENQQLTALFPKGNQIPSFKALTLLRSSTFSIDVVYAHPEELQSQAKISTYTIGPFETSNGQRAKLKGKFCLNLHGIVSLNSATMLEKEEADVPIPVSNETLKMESDVSSNNPISADTDVKMQDSLNSTVENGSADVNRKPDEKSAQVEMNSKPVPSKKKIKKISIPVSEKVYDAMSAANLEKAKEEEYKMAFQDRVMEETKDKKNAVEAYVYDMRNKLINKYHDFVTENERESFTKKLQEVEDWLYEDGEDESKGVYIAKLEELKKQGDPIDERYKESFEREPVANQLLNCIRGYREAALSNDGRFDHINIADKEKVVNECIQTETWLNEKKQQQSILPKSGQPVLLTADMKMKIEFIDRFCKPIMTKPKPAPVKPQTPRTEPPPASSTQQQPDGTTDEVMDAADGNTSEVNEPVPSSDPMETDKPETDSPSA
ncbi:Heat shock 70 kDa protein 14 [Zostera marina]|uniref:Heat shock 70 kDa protein 14 n=1 Tax=Zostera marina TaxID=29655 RepID=A0A0K9NI68_ZOSMR|nr:Heat shock 70 kDa protein 14 [Zostera marina]